MPHLEADSVMFEQAAAFGEQLRTAAPLARGLLDGRGPFRQVLLCGLGGSAASGRLAVGMLERELALPVVVAGARELPAWAGADTLVVATSYSGESMETLDWYRQALARGACAAAITAGGTLAGLAEQHGAPLVRVAAGLQPRGALGLLLSPLLVLLHEAGACDDPSGLIERGAAAADATVARVGMGSDGGEALRSAERLAGRGAVLYGCGVRAAAAVRLKNQINENAKAAAFAGALPEIAHNEVLGWVGHEREGLGMVAVFLRDEAETPGERVLADSVAELVEPDAAALLEWRGEGPDEVSRAFSLLALGDHVSCYLGQMEGVDLLDITRLQLLKRRLAGSG